MSTTLGAFLAGGIAACGAVTATHPFETVKIRCVPVMRIRMSSPSKSSADRDTRR
ncbi:hypothetical protein BN1723_001445, partial [Verticillium longisporum]